MLRTLLALILLGSLTTSTFAESPMQTAGMVRPAASALPSIRCSAPSSHSTGLTALSTSTSQACCKICHVGKACGDTCISHDKICHVGPGCACDE